MNYWISQRKIFKWIVLTTTVLIAVRVYYVQELIAAFVIFSLLFACLAGVVLIVFLLDHAAQTALAWAEVCVRAFGRVARRGWERAEVPTVRRSFQFDRSGAQPLPRTTNNTGWDGWRANQGTDVAYVLGDLTPLSTKVAGIVRAVNVSHFQQESKGDVHRHNPAR
jgi:hypothetical protein